MSEITKTPIWTLPDATDSDISAGSVIVVANSRAKKAPAIKMKGVKGDNAYIGVRNGYIVGKTGAGEWQNLKAFSELKGTDGKPIQFRKGTTGLEWKIEGAADSTYQVAILYSDIKLKFSDLTTLEKAEIKMKFSDLTAADISVLQQPASDVVFDLRQLETLVVSSETARVAAETTRISNEATRITNETARKSDETIRATKETARISNEDTRILNETNRITAETSRTTAETKRQTDMAKAIEDANVATEAANNAAELATEAATHSSYTDADGWVWEYDFEQKKYIKTSKCMKGAGLDYTTMTPDQIANITGKSAFDVAKDNGFEGTEEEWLLSLNGKDANMDEFREELGALAFKEKINYTTDIDSLPSIPSKISDLQNDSGFQTAQQVAEKVTELISNAPDALDTLKELADALGNDPNFATTISALIAQKVEKIDGMGLSKNNFTDEYKKQLEELPENITLPEGVVTGVDKNKVPVNIQVCILSESEYNVLAEYNDNTVYHLYSDNPSIIVKSYYGKLRIPATSIVLNKTSLTLKPEEEETLTYTVSPANSTEKIIWISSDTSIVTVSAAGKVKAIRDGTATIEAKTESGKIKATCSLNVTSEFQIGSVSDLLAFKTALEAGNEFSGQTVRLTKDINMSGQAWQCNFLKIFKGTFEGDIKTISNLTMSGAYASLIPCLEGKVQNLILSNVVFNSSGTAQYMGSITAKAENGAVIQDSSILGLTANMNVNYSAVGGVVGSAGGSTILRRIVVKNLNMNITRSSQNTNYDAVGGLVGCMTAVNPVENCFTTGNVKANSIVGGIVGYGSFSNTNTCIQKCYSSVVLESVFLNNNSNGSASIIGYVTKGKIDSCISLSTSIKASVNAARVAGYTSGTTLSANSGLSTALVNGLTVTSWYGEGYANGAHKTDAELKTQATYEALNWDFGAVWKIGSAGYPVMKWDN